MLNGQSRTAAKPMAFGCWRSKPTSITSIASSVPRRRTPHRRSSGCSRATARRWRARHFRHWQKEPGAISSGQAPTTLAPQGMSAQKPSGATSPNAKDSNSCRRPPFIPRLKLRGIPGGKFNPSWASIRGAACSRNTAALHQRMAAPAPGAGNSSAHYRSHRP